MPQASFAAAASGKTDPAEPSAHRKRIRIPFPRSGGIDAPALSEQAYKIDLSARIGLGVNTFHVRARRITFDLHLGGRLQ